MSWFAVLLAPEWRQWRFRENTNEWLVCFGVDSRGKAKRVFNKNIVWTNVFGLSDLNGLLDSVPSQVKFEMRRSKFYSDSLLPQENFPCKFKRNSREKLDEKQNGFCADLKI